MKNALSILAALGVAVGMYIYGTERNRGLVPSWFDNLFFQAWGLMVLIGAFAVLRENERRFLGTVSKPFRLQPGEDLILTAKFLSAEFYRHAGAFNPEPTFREWTRTPLMVLNLLWVRLTDRRLVFGIPWRTWRYVPLTDVIRVSEIPRRWPYLNAFLIEYRFDGRREALVLNKRLKRSRELMHKLAFAVSSRPGASMKGAGRGNVTSGE